MKTNKQYLSKVVLTIAGVALVATGCVVHEHANYPVTPVAVVETAPVSRVGYVSSQPPAPLADVVTVAPAPGYVWVGGAWYWNGGWVWRYGYWTRPPRFGAVWVGPRYYYRGGRSTWYGGYWRYR
jgi:hypothetical protein